MQVAVYNFKLVCTLSIVGKRVSEKRCPRKGGENRWREKVAREKVETQEKVASRRALCTLAAAALARRRRCTRISRTT